MNSSILKFHYLIAVAVCLPLLSSCTNTKITSVWMDSEKAGTTFNDILIIGIADEEHNRRLFEEQFTSQLKAAGIQTSVSYTLLPQGIDINRDTVSAAIEGKTVDAVIVTHLVAVEEETVYRPSMDYQPAYGYYNGLYSYYPHVHTYVHQPGYYTTHDIVKLETNLYEVATEQLVWSAQSSSFAPESAKEVIDELVNLVIKDLQQKGLITAKQ